MLIPCVVGLSLWFGAGPARAAVDMFLKIDGIEGESTDKDHSKEIDVLAWAWGASNSGTTHVGGGGGAGKVSVQDLSITKYVDKASPKLMLKVCNGVHIPTVTLVVRRAGASPTPYITIKLEEVLVSSISTSGSGGADRFTENISLNFAKITYEYYPQNEDGTAGDAVTETWDILASAL
ncbi:MAG: type VI secretion system tube protein Hcp [Verrucomicrobiota bacterium]|nr:type VI secretion system tube protein Hcp [Limisphaerales bacterium]